MFLNYSMIKKSLIKAFDNVKRFDIVIGMFTLVIAMFIFKEFNRTLTTSKPYLIAHSVIFIAALIAFIIILAPVILDGIRNMKKKDKIILAIVAGISILFVYVLQGSNVYGRFQILRWMMGDVFIPTIFADTLVTDPRSYSMVIYSLLKLLGISVTPMTLLMVNKVYAVFLLIAVYLVAQQVFQKRWISFMVLFAFVSSRFIQINLVSIEYGIASILFLTISLFFILKFTAEQRFRYLLLACTAAIIASYFRYELAFLFGLPLMLYYCLFLRDRKTWILMSSTALLLILNFISVVKYFSNYEDTYLTGNSISLGLISYIKNIGFILYHNIIIQNDLSINSGYANLFTYIGILASVGLVVFLVIRYFKGKSIEYKQLYILVFFYLFYLFFQLTFHIEGLRSAQKYSVNFYLPEIIIVFFALIWIVQNALLKEKKIIIDITNIVVIFSFITLSIASSPSMGVSPIHYAESEFSEFIKVKELQIDKECYILKVTPAQPKLDYYLDTQEKAIYLGMPPYYYTNFAENKQEGRCYYFYDERFKQVTDADYIEIGTYEHYYYVDPERVDSLMEGCSKEVIAKIPTLVRFFDNDIYKEKTINKKIIKYSC